ARFCAHTHTHTHTLTHTHTHTLPDRMPNRTHTLTHTHTHTHTYSHKHTHTRRVLCSPVPSGTERRTTGRGCRTWGPGLLGAGAAPQTDWGGADAEGVCVCVDRKS